MSTGAAIGFPALLRAQGLDEKLQVAFVGVDGQARKHLKACHQAGLQCVAFADVDKSVWHKVHDYEGWEGARGTTDWREMFQRDGQSIDVLFVTTPDHTHFAPTMTAITWGIHCYTEKPLTWSVKEAQLLTQAYARQKNVVTQMGNHGHAKNGWRIAYDYIKAGAIGEVKAFHTWTDHPKWAQGGDGPGYTSPVPENLNWDAWIGPAAMRPYAGPAPDAKRKWDTPAR